MEAMNLFSTLIAPVVIDNIHEDFMEKQNSIYFCKIYFTNLFNAFFTICIFHKIFAVHFIHMTKPHKLHTLNMVYQLYFIEAEEKTNDV